MSMKTRQLSRLLQSIRLDDDDDESLHGLDECQLEQPMTRAGKLTVDPTATTSTTAKPISKPLGGSSDMDKHALVAMSASPQKVAQPEEHADLAALTPPPSHSGSELHNKLRSEYISAGKHAALARSTTAPAPIKSQGWSAEMRAAVAARPISMVERTASWETPDHPCPKPKKLRRQNSLPKRLLSFLTGKKGRKSASSEQHGARQTIAGTMAPGPLLETMAEPTIPIGEHDEPDLEVIQSAGPKPYSSNDFEYLMTLATGSFGAATLSRHKASDKPCVVKSIEKHQTVMKSQVVHVMHERDTMKLLTESECPFIVRTYGAFHDQRQIYFVLEYVPGGELFSYMRQKGRFPEADAAFYSAQVVMALEHMHVRHGIIYRDLKPENILIGSDGYIKICDFGFAKKLGRMEKTYTQCGTTDYLSPETIMSKGHGHEVDLWTLGVLIFEMLAGEVPFVAESTIALYGKILKGSFSVPSYFSPAAKQIIQGLLCVDRTKRLGCSRAGIAEVRAAPFFRQIDFAQLAAKALPAPYTPKVIGPFDMQLFTETASPFDASDLSKTPPLHPLLDQKHFADFDCVIADIARDP